MTQAGSVPEARQISVLLVDDDPFTCDICRLIFDHHELPLAIKTNALEALEYLREHAADIIILDLVLPDIDGYESLDAIRRLPRGGRYKVIATTAYYTPDTYQEVLNRGFDGYLPKPFSANRLIPFLTSLLT